MSASSSGALAESSKAMTAATDWQRVAGSGLAAAYALLAAGLVVILVAAASGRVAPHLAGVGPGWWVVGLWAGTAWLIRTGQRLGLWLALLCPLAALGLWHGLPNGAFSVAWLVAAVTPMHVLISATPAASLLQAPPLPSEVWLAHAAHAAWVSWLLWSTVGRASPASASPSAIHGSAEAAVPAGPLVLPASKCAMYAQHPLRVLGLTLEQCSTRNLMRRRDEMLALLEAGQQPAASIDGYVRVCWPAAAEPSAEEVRRAVARLQQEPDRLGESLLWFRLNEAPEAERQALARGDLVAAELLWRAQSAPTAPQRTNLAVLAHLHLLESEPAADDNTAQWLAVHGLWRQAAGSDGFGEPLAAAIAAAKDPRLTNASPQSLTREMVTRLLAVHAEFVRVALTTGHPAFARRHLNIIERSGWPAPAVDSACEELFEPWLREARRACAGLLDPAARLTDGKPDKASFEKAYGSARRPFEALDACRRLATLANEVTPLVAHRLMQETNKTWREFCEEDNAVFGFTHKLVELWNESSDRFVLGVIHDHGREHRARVDGLRGKLETFCRSVDHEVEVLDMVRLIAQDADADVRRAAEEQGRKEREARERAREEYRKTREHFDRNVGGMGRQLGR